MNSSLIPGRAECGAEFSSVGFSLPVRQAGLRGFETSDPLKTRMGSATRKFKTAQGLALLRGE